ncbi:hypothetical protein QAD02_019442 [Eretmocerus hayati]|uniref:Uncharacterized protein n=1 Tax=Eretmocerus hayati TaxID=131215 RepID=A0ACC2PJ86_9HYME|nr:hypothetical protein QAD02_019442 [Eretmocerus hayati]
MTSMSGKIKLDRLRKLMENVSYKDHKGIQAYVVPSDDAHQSEYISPSDERRAFISGFNGSYGTAVITPDKALLWTDGRYFVQATAQLDPPDAWTLMKDGVIGTPTLETWLVENLPDKSAVGADPHLISNTVWTRLQNSLNSAGHSLLPIERNLVDEIWGNDKPPKVLNKIVPQRIEFTGRTAGEKIAKCLEEMQKNKAAVMVLSALDEVAYLLNWRGSDVPYNPVFFAYVVLIMKKVHIFVDESRLTSEAKQQLANEGVDFAIHPYDRVNEFLKQMSSETSSSSKIWIANSVSYSLHSNCESGQIHAAITPVALMKQLKTDAEIEGMKNAHIKDAVALVQFYAWLENEIVNKKSFVTEISAAEQLENFRKVQENFVGQSFPTISSVGAHGAIIHYRPEPSTDAQITDREFYLCDAGSQFLDGTTDVTRTLHFGQPSEYERECFTRVFKGQTYLSMAKFPLMTKGNHVDVLARKYLWDIGLDYLHGTGHGVGAYLNVHESPTMIHRRPAPDDPGLQPGMFLSNEPGYYEDGKFGIRIENVELVVYTSAQYAQERKYLGFETVTLVPIQTRLLNLSLLTTEEIQHLNSYHKRCYETLEPLLQGPQNAQALRWLERETKAICKP